jgi:uncharacterized protein
VRLAAGTPVRCEMTKWGDRPHWVYDGTYLGADEHGDWIGFPEGSRFTRPGAEYVAPYDQVGLVPPDQGWVAAFHSPGGKVWVYVDITTVPVWDGATVRAVDLDLDVVRGVTGRVWVDDEDEFAQRRGGYPDDVVAHALRTCADVETMVRDRVAPFHDAERWLARVGQ